jgi:ABC-2 type transport system permease protein
MRLRDGWSRATFEADRYVEGDSEMLWYKAWRESRLRFLLGAALISGMCLVYALLVRRLFPGVAHDHPAVRNYVQYIHWTVYGGAGRAVLQLTCLLLGLGGMQRERKQGTLGFTLALPVSRAHLVLTRAGLGFAQVIALALLPPVLLGGASHLAHEQMPLSYGLRFVPLWAIGGLLTFSISFLFSALLNSEYVSLAVSYTAYMFYLAATRHPTLGRFHLHVADFMSGLVPGAVDRNTMLWGSTYPLAAAAGFFLAGVGLILVSTYLTLRQDL